MTAVSLLNEKGQEAVQIVPHGYSFFRELS
jgi:hypothetical protein